MHSLLYHFSSKLCTLFTDASRKARTLCDYVTFYYTIEREREREREGGEKEREVKKGKTKPIIKMQIYLN